MTRMVTSLSALILSIVLLVSGNAFLMTLLGIRLSIESVPPDVIGWVLVCYSIGFVLGTLYVQKIITRVGHIRAFAVFAAVAAVASLMYPMAVSMVFWAFLRAVSGFSIAGVLVVIESWFSSRATNANRGALFAVYQIVFYLSAAGGQLVVNIGDPSNFMPFSIAAMLLVLALGWALLRYQQRLLAALAGAVALYLALDFEVLRQAGMYFSHPLFGNGLSQEGGDSLLVSIPDGLRVLPHPNNVLLAVVHSTGLIGLALFIAAWAVPAWRLPDAGREQREGAVFLVALLPGLLTMLSAGAYLLVPFHPSWMCLWLPLALMLASLSNRDTMRRPVRAGQG